MKKNLKVGFRGYSWVSFRLDGRVSGSRRALSMKPSSFTDLDGDMRNHVLPFFGETPINEITSSKIEKFLRHLVGKKRISPRMTEKKAKTLSFNTISHIKANLSAILSAAGAELAFVNPFKFISKSTLAEILSAAPGSKAARRIGKIEPIHESK